MSLVNERYNPLSSRSWLENLKIQALVSLVTPGLFLLTNSWRFRRCYHPDTQALLDNGRPVIFATWHHNVYASVGILSPLQRGHLAILISHSNDGEMITNSLCNIGFKHIIRGSSKRGGVKALQEMRKALTISKHHVFFAADGPQGPRHQVKEGIIRLASQSGAPIIPVRTSCKHLLFHAKKSWDQFELPQFFSNIDYDVCGPIWVPKGIKMPEQVAPLLQQLTTSLTQCP
jgi:lysophospholipid acyltransferase (LPLAT)-like uncharacterized protein